MNIKTQVKSQKIVCPNCGEASYIDMYEVINTRQNPELKNAVRDGGLFGYACGCGFKSVLVYPTLYIDPDAEIIIALCTTEQFVPETTDKLNEIARGEPDAGYIMRIVPTYDRLREKLYIFDAELDDRAVELYKAALLSQLKATGRDPLDTAYFYISDGVPKIQFFEGGRGKTADFHIDDCFYFAGIADSMDGGFIIDENWAKNAVTAGFLK